MFRARLAIGIICLLALAGCSSGQSTAAPLPEFSGIGRVAVVKVEGPLFEAAQNQIADLTSRQLLQKGYLPVERQQIEAVLTEQQFQQSGKTEEADAVAIGQLLNVPAVMIINVPRYDEKMNLTAKLVRVRDGAVLWIGSGTGSTGGLAQTVGGALAGGLVGGVIGHEVGGGGGGTAVGAAVGGAAGGLTGNVLSPQAAEQIEKVLDKMFEEFPSRGQVARL